MKFKVGDRVRLLDIDCMTDEVMVGDVGTVKDFEKFPSFTFFTVMFDRVGYTQSCFENQLELDDIKRYQIIISSDGKITTAEMIVNGKAVKSCVAKCSPDDKFNFRTGAELAFNRLFAKKGKETYNPGQYDGCYGCVHCDDPEEDCMKRNCRGAFCEGCHPNKFQLRH